MQRIPILMTRPEGSNRAFLDAVAPEWQDRLQPVISPLLEIVSLSEPEDIGPQDGAIFTSSNGVKYAPQGRGRTAYCVGDHTTRNAQTAGWSAICAGADATELVETLQRKTPDIALCHFHGVHLRVDVAERLRAAGLNVSSKPVYDQRLAPLTEEAQELLAGQDLVFVPLFSPRTASHFASLAPVSSKTIIIAMSDAVAAECTSRGFASVYVAEHPTAASMVNCLEKTLSEVCAG